MAAIDDISAGVNESAGQVTATLALVATFCLALVGLMVPILLPIGEMYWDTHIYIDAAHRISTGQLPSVDFFTPAGPLGYYLAWLGLNVSANAQPLLAASWSIMLVSVPIMALVAWDGARHAPGAAIATTLAFCFFSFVPFNTGSYYPFPAADGFGIYNRQGAQLMLVVTAAIVLMRNPRLQAVAIGLAMAALFFTKITAFLAAGLICAFGLLVGRVSWITAILSAAIAIAIAGAVELATGIVSAYVVDIATLVNMNTEALAPRMVQAASRTVGIVAPAGLVLLALLAWPADAGEPPKTRRFHLTVLDRPAWWIGVVLVAGLFYESQNTGSQLHIALWPVMVPVAIALAGQRRPDPRVWAILVLIAATLLPPVVNTTQSALRAVAVMAKQQRLQHDNLGAMGQVTVRPRKLERLERMRAHYIEHAEATRAIAMRGELPAYVLYSEHDFQIGLLKDADELVARLRQLEANGLRYDTIMTLDFANPFPWLLAKRAPRHIAIGADPYRAVPAPDDDVVGSVRDTDIVLEPQCPYRDNVRQLSEIYATALEGRVRVTLTPCYSAWVHPKLAPSF